MQHWTIDVCILVHGQNSDMSKRRQVLAFAFIFHILIPTTRRRLYFISAKSFANHNNVVIMLCSSGTQSSLDSSVITVRGGYW